MSSYTAKIQSFRTRIAELKLEFEELMTWHEAIALAHAERTGCELQQGEEYSAEDERRAEEIMRLYPGNDA